MQRSAIVVLAAGIAKEYNKYASTRLFENREYIGTLGGELRIFAAAELFKRFKFGCVIVSGGKGVNLKPAVFKFESLSKVMKQELVQIGIPTKFIVEENKSNTTLEQLNCISRLIKILGCNKIILISNKYHLGRVKNMILIKILPLAKMFENKQLKLQSAESILLKFQAKKWSKQIDKFYHSDLFEKIKKNEQQGIKDLKQGKYASKYKK